MVLRKIPKQDLDAFVDMEHEDEQMLVGSALITRAKTLEGHDAILIDGNVDFIVMVL